MMHFRGSQLESNIPGWLFWWTEQSNGCFEITGEGKFGQSVLRQGSNLDEVKMLAFGDAIQMDKQLGEARPDLFET